MAWNCRELGKRNRSPGRHLGRLRSARRSGNGCARPRQPRASGLPLSSGKVWASPDLRPCPVMVWLPVHCGQFLDSIEGERLFAAFTFTMFSGLRQDEIVGLNWAEVDLDEGVAYVRETGSGNDPKSDAGTRAVPLSAVVAKDLKAWRKAQAATTRVGTGLARHRPCLHARGWRADHGPVAVAEFRYPRLARRPALCPVPRSPARRRVAGQGRRRVLEGDLSAARPLAAELHRHHVRDGLPGCRQSRRRGRRRARPPEEPCSKLLRGLRYEHEVGQHRGRQEDSRRPG